MNATRRHILAAAGALSLAGLPLGAFAAPTLTVRSRNAERRTVDVVVPENPQRVAALDAAVLENLEYFGLESRIVAAVNPGAMTWLKPLPKTVVLLGSLKNVDVKAVAAAKPDLIYISGRAVRAYKQYSEVAPTVCPVTGGPKGPLPAFRANLLELGRVFGRTAEAKKAVAQTEARVERIAAKAAGEKIAVLMMVGGRINVAADGGPCTFLSRGLGFTNVKPAPKEAPRPPMPPQGAGQGNPPPKPTPAEIAAKNEKAFAELAALKPSRIFVLNKDTAVGLTEPHLLADAVKGSAAWAALDAVKAGRVHELTGAAWYLGEGGVASMERQLTDVERALGL